MDQLKRLPKKYEAGFLQKMDCRSSLGRRLTLSYQSILDDCGGQPNRLPYAKLALIERFAFLEEALRQIEKEMILEGKQDREALLSRWIQGINSMVGLAKLLGLHEPKADVLDLLYADDPADTPDTPDTATDGPIHAVEADNPIDTTEGQAAVAGHSRHAERGGR